MVSTDYNKSLEMVEDFASLSYKAITKAKETEDQFIFDTLNNFTREHYQITVEKDELVKAIQLVRIMREHNIDIRESYTTATHKKAALDDAYQRGLQDGIAIEHNRVMDILNNRS